MATPVYIVGNTHRFRFTFTKDGLAWADIDYVNVLLVDPQANVTSRTATVENTTQGIWYYDTIAGSTGDLDEQGDWKLFPKATDGAIVITGGPFLFSVQAVGNEG